jgi:hypothetical protein
LADTENRRVKGYPLGEPRSRGIWCRLPRHAVVVTWNFVYQNVIRYFYLIYPGMFLRLPFQNEATARQNATIIRQMVSKDSWDTTTYMPVSRDLSDGKRKLLQRWCALNE